MKFEEMRLFKANLVHYVRFFVATKKKEDLSFHLFFFCRWNEGIAAGQSRPKSAPAFRPRYCFLDKKVLRFFAYFQEVAGLDDRAPEKRIRHVHILYHLEDDSISILEPRTNVIISSFITCITAYLHLLTVFENRRKNLIQYCERSKLRLHFELTKVH